METRRFSPLDVGIGVLALVGAVYFAHLLQDSINNVQPLRSGDAKLVGKVEVLRQGVRVKTLEDYSWYPLKNDTPVYTGDTIFTGSDSQAVLRLGAGRDEIRLEPFSLITLSEREGLAEVTLHFGEFESDLSQSGLVVNADGERSVMQADGASVRLRKESQKLNLEVLRGDVELNRAGEKKVLGESQTLSLLEPVALPAGEEVLTLQPPPPAPELPQAKSTYHVPNDRAVEFSNGLYRVPPPKALRLTWEAEEKAKAYEVIFARDENFEDVLSVRKFQQPKVDLRVVPQTGFFWKVRAQGEDWSEFSEPGRVDVTVPPLANGPLAEPTFEILDEERAVAVHELYPFPGVDQLQVEYKLQDETRWRSTLLPSPRLELEGLRGQDTLWRARPVNATGQAVGPYSEAHKVHFAEEMFIPPEPEISPEELAYRETRAQALARPPVLRAPAHQETFIAFGDTPSYLVFDWKAHEAVQQHTLQVARDAGFADLILDKNVDKTNYVFTGQLEPGVYYWRVRALFDGDNSPWSRTKSVRVDSP